MLTPAEDIIVHNCSSCGETTDKQDNFNWNEDETLSCRKCGKKAKFVHNYNAKPNTYAFK